MLSITAAQAEHLSAEARDAFAADLTDALRQEFAQLDVAPRAEVLAYVHRLLTVAEGLGLSDPEALGIFCTIGVVAGAAVYDDPDLRAYLQTPALPEADRLRLLLDRIEADAGDGEA